MTENVAAVAEQYERLRSAVTAVVRGQDDVFELLCVALYSGGHVLLEGVPGTAKTLLANLLARSVDAGFRRIQFTPDLMPADILGTNVFDLTTGHFNLKRGPIFTQVLLADEINRAPAKTQSALLEAMEERQVTLEGERYVLEPPFFVVATQNPIDYEGTYPLPEAQLDRFMFKLNVPYPPHAAELDVLRMYHGGFDAHDLSAAGIRPVVSPADLGTARREIAALTVDDGVLDYMLAIVEATRSSRDVSVGAGPRAGIALLLTAKTLAAFRGRSYVLPDDVKTVAHPVLRHRLILRPEAEIEGLQPDTIVERILSRVPVPR